jgi:thioredoxin-related protein
LDEGIVLAHQSNKKILVDVYTGWCTWCKKMDAEVYTDKNVINLIDKHFIPVKLDAESSRPVSFQGKSFSEAEFARQVGVTGYPTTLFFDQNSNPITDMPGFAPADKFADVLGFIGQDYYKSISFQEYVSQHTSTP